MGKYLDADEVAGSGQKYTKTNLELVVKLKKVEDEESDIHYPVCDIRTL